MNSDEWCKHYHGLAYPGSCGKGVDYDSVIDFSTRPASVPCYDPEARHLCAAFEGYTDAEIAERKADILAVLKKHNDFWARKTEDCPMCGKHVDKLIQVRRCAYARPCGCRIAQGRVPDAWK